MEQTAPPPPPPAGGHTKHFVFVDEYNRHKRLKVMRACDGCRKRKIRCDGALQNGPWPCGACVRLKLKCVPPSVEQDDDERVGNGEGVSSEPNQLSFHSVTFSAGPQQLHAPPPMPPHDREQELLRLQSQQQHQLHQQQQHQRDITPRPPAVRAWSTSSSALPTPASLDHGAIDSSVYPVELLAQHLTPPLQRSYSDDDFLGGGAHGQQNHMHLHHHQQQQQQQQQQHHRLMHPRARTLAPAGQTPTPTPPPPRSVTSAGAGGLSPAPTDDPEGVEAAVKELSDQMGDLTIDHLSVAPWIANQKKYPVDAPSIEEADVLLPHSVFTDPVVAIPAEMMPSDARCLDYFGYFFAFIHPYVPVLNRRQFYDRWRTARATVSPLLLEGIFACVARYLEDITEVRRWLALAGRHEESFKDVPRLSTIQAMLLLTKAREYVPKRGYYYRSWMSVKYMITMAFDLGLHEHHLRHPGSSSSATAPGVAPAASASSATPTSCELSRADCMVRTRIWQTLFVLEILVGAPQGRTDFSIELDTVDLSLPSTIVPDPDPFEYQLSRRTAYWTHCVRNIKITNQLWQTLRRRRPDWALDPQFGRHNDAVTTWLDTLPADMSIRYEDDGSPPFLAGEHFVPYVHTYHWLIIIMQHRPRLQTLLEQRDPHWRRELDICLRAGERMCQLQEALLNTFGLHGLQFMVRGINYSIYCVLSCLMLHLAAITSPEPETNLTARRYFTRHMRVLEHCTPGASQDVQVQIDALREAFSADTSKPFELKPTLGLQSPALDPRPPPPPILQRVGVDGAGSGGGDAPAWARLPGADGGAAAAAAAMAMAPGYSEATYGGIDDGQGGAYDLPPGSAYSLQAAYAPHISPSPSSAASGPSGYTLEPQLSNDPSAQTDWNPSGIFSQWNVAFGGGPAAAAAAAAAQAPSPASVAAASQMQMNQLLAHQQQPTHAPQDPSMPIFTAVQHTSQLPAVAPMAQQSHHHAALLQQQMPHQQSSVDASPPSDVDEASLGPAVPTVTSHMWQDVFTNAYASGHGHKRYREDELTASAIVGNVGLHGDPYGHYNKRRA